MQIHKYDGDRDNPILDALFALADDSEQSIAAYRDKGELFVALVDGNLVGELLLTEQTPEVLEIKSVAVDEATRGIGVGDGLVEAAVERARDRGAQTLRVGTAAADLDNLGFYQRRGFRPFSVERDAFSPEKGYPEENECDGIPVLDRVWLELEIS